MMAWRIGWRTKSRRRDGKAGSALVLGLTFKEDVPDLRNSKVADMIGALVAKGYRVTVHDPLADAAEAQHEFGIPLAAAPFDTTYDVVLLAVPHASYRALDANLIGSLVAPGGAIFDLKGAWRDLAV